MRSIIYFFDKLEDHVRGYFSRYPLWYAFIGGTAVVLFWRGVWHTADDYGLSSLSSLVLGIVILLVTGLFASMFIGDQIIMSGLRHEKKVTDETEREIKSERDILVELSNEVKSIKEELRKNRAG